MDVKAIRLEQAILTLNYLKSKRDRIRSIVQSRAADREELEEAEYRVNIQELEVKLLRLE